MRVVLVVCSIAVSVVVAMAEERTTRSSAVHSSPNHHPLNLDLLRDFGGHFRCPYADDWLTKGPEQAALDLGLISSSSDNDDADKSGSGGGRANATKATMTRLLSTIQRHPGTHSLRRTQDDTNVAGSCVYTNPWTGAPSCVEMRGATWTEDSMQSKCNDLTEATMALQTPCTRPASLAGWCLVERNNDEGEDNAAVSSSSPMMEAHPLPLSDGGTASSCASMRSTCETMIRGAFEPADSCVVDGGGGSYEEGNIFEGGNNGGGPPAAGSSEETMSSTCSLAPGPIGAAHQAAYSNGYGRTCAGTPAEGSPYMWPPAWTAHVESKSMPFQTDEVLYHSRGIAYYRLDKNWKRSDTTYQYGIQRHVGMGSCPEEDVVTGEWAEGGIRACRRDSDRRSTMIHRGAKMFFISWKNDTSDFNDAANIEECKWLDLKVIGNVRPDWFMDDRGDSTDVQYLGNQHVFYQNEPRLVKQWRKKDFANQYFVMSVLVNALNDNVHWPMTINVPGEGFGDDYLKIYTNQSLLTDDDDHIFLLDEALEAMGGSCPQMEGWRGGTNKNKTKTDGPPTGKQAHVPSNLEVDPNAWYSNVYTFSPVWEPPAKTDESEGNHHDAAAGSSMAVTRAGDDVTVSSCYDPDAGVVQLKVKFTNVDISGGPDDNTLLLPWMALGYRETGECLMTPRGGGDSKIILISSSTTSGDGASTSATYGPLSPSLKQFGGERSSPAEYFAESHVPLDQAEGFSNVELIIIPDPAADAASGSLPIAAASDHVEGEYDEALSSTVELHFHQSTGEAAPEQMYLMYAVGNSPHLGYHASRVCFEVEEFPTCADAAAAAAAAESAATTTAGTLFATMALMSLSANIALLLW